jgi:hypothetical protein
MFVLFSSFLITLFVSPKSFISLHFLPQDIINEASSSLLQFSPTNRTLPIFDNDTVSAFTQVNIDRISMNSPIERMKSIYSLSSLIHWSLSSSSSNLVFDNMLSSFKFYLDAETSLVNNLTQFCFCCLWDACYVRPLVDSVSFVTFAKLRTYGKPFSDSKPTLFFYLIFFFSNYLL